MANTLLIRADATTQMGFGHAVRCLALAQAWKAHGGEVHFAFVELSDALKSAWGREASSLHCIEAASGSSQDVESLAKLCRALNADWLVIDGYQFGQHYHVDLRRLGIRFLAIDDYSQIDHACADLVLNQNMYASEEMYPRRSHETRLLLGSRYCLLRAEFGAYKSMDRRVPKVATRLLVSLGGSDPDNHSLRVIEAIKKSHVPNASVVLVIGGGNPHSASLKKVAAESSILIHVEQNSTRMASLMAEADLAIVAGGTTCWEVAFMGLPAMVTVLAENQALVANSMAAHGVGINLGRPENLDTDTLTNRISALAVDQATRQTMSSAGRLQIDGGGSARVVLAMMPSPASITLPRGEFEDPSHGNL